MATSRKWWKEGVIYQIYPRSFKDSNGDGIGDLPGILSELDHIAGLGVDIVWLNPVFASPGEDNGYDISDYTAIQPEYGRMEDLEELIRALHVRKIRLVMDMVINHTSDEHEWFRQARTGRSNPYYEFYHWWPAEKGDPPHRESFFDPQGRGWEYNEATDSWYLHIFSYRQPDLNWENPQVRSEIYAILRFWLNKGVDGFRLDAITFISKDIDFPPVDRKTLREKYRNDWGHYYSDGPRLHEYLREMHAKVLTDYDAVAIAEAPGILPDHALQYVDPGRKELDMLCHFDGIGVGYLPGEFKKLDPDGYKASDLKKVYTLWNDVFREKGWGTIYLGNHDQPRMVSRWGNDNEAFRIISAKMLFTFLLSMRATPFIYNGDEIGMTNIRFQRIEEYKDVETRTVYRKIINMGGDGEAFLKDQQMVARDNSRTPFQWSAAPNGGFTSGEPWIRVNENYTFINKEAQEKDPWSILHYTRELIRLRRQHAALIYGEYELVNAGDSLVYAYTRSLNVSRLFVVLNFSQKEPDFIHPFPGLAKKDILTSNYPDIRLDSTDDGGGIIRLLPYQSIIFSIPTMDQFPDRPY